jgi:hemoglobin
MDQKAKVKGFVEAFYSRVRLDSLLNPVFSRVIAEEKWPEHLETMTNFWMAVGFAGPAFSGDPMTKHARIGEITSDHFERWLAIFEVVANEYWDKEVAAQLILRSTKIASSLLLGVERARQREI